MALKIISKPTFTATVAVNTVMVQGTLDVQYVGYPTDELRGMEETARAAGLNVQLEVLKRVVCGFEPVAMPDGNTVLRFTGAEAVVRLCDFPGLLTALIARYYDALWETRLGNSAPLPAGSSTTVADGQPATTSSGPTSSASLA